MGKLKILYRAITLILSIGVLSSCGVRKSLQEKPDIAAYETQIPQRQKINDSTYTLSDNFLRKNKQGLWELRVSGNPLELGLKTGSLTQELFNEQEDIFVKKIDELVPSKGYQNLLRKFLAWFNRKMYLNIDAQYKTELYGISKYASPDYDYIAKPYQRVMYFHGAHDIGHALQDLALVGCSSFAAWGDKTEDGKLFIGRNFDFYAGDEFAKNKIIAFVEPENGHKFMSVTWGGMIGVVSGMNDQGLTVTINAGKSQFPLIAKTPVSLVTREILQYASTIEEAIAIAKKRDVFVSESIFVGSAKDKKAAIIEVSPHNFGVYEVENNNQLICANHFQSAAYADDKKNQKHILESHSQYRYERMEELLEETSKVNPTEVVSILRDKQGLDEEQIGYGNEKALNQLLAHHGIVFQPEDLLVWVSSNPYQLGEFVAYDLKEVFNLPKVTNQPIAQTDLNIPKDPFLQSEAYKNYERYRMLRDEIEDDISEKAHIDQSRLENLVALNPNFWEGYFLAGVYNYNMGYDYVAKKYFEKALEKEITTVPDRENVEKYLRKLR
ncbi:C45 family autoproteolytic acyltransferase/hydolase [Maribacter cobaltidurans]|uniref:Acyl-CoA--6-aminopenicillanic acid acyl-transferase n=1 Tax=Maribacter cobaltidurans TaxID=1178778 RepID=A0A223V4A6_9FLAO|nr:C45 family peptidase [Maribacter cobaltidurans]ASV29838.1 acyl-CoA--6-aminopenicillanic acid acyl-transferase [Maribacter cobaltidurans]GGD92078.1 acyl-CoA--6-aminopenicillanic acid acyl-transferase [Maribacter cobaltidurans]